jgi:hypothetical protein
LLALLAEGKSQVGAAEQLRLERYPADDRTIRRDVFSLRGQWGEKNMSEFQRWQAEHIAELQELRAKLEDPLIRPAEKVALMLAIIREDSKIKGTAAPSKSVHANVSGPQLDALYLDIRDVLLDADEQTRQEVLEDARAKVKSRRKPVVVDGMPLQPIERMLTDGQLS